MKTLLLMAGMSAIGTVAAAPPFTAFTAFANHAAGAASRISDGQLDGQPWQGGAKNHSVGIDFGRSVRVNKVLIVSNARSAANPRGALQLLEGSVNYVQWQRIDQQGHCEAKFQRHTYTQCVFSPAIRTRFLRLRQGNDAVALKVFELVPQ